MSTPSMPARPQPARPWSAPARPARTVAIDGPSGSGKSSVSRSVADELGLRYLDTGAMYRAVTWWCLHTGVSLSDGDAVAQAARDLDLVVGTDPRDPRVTVAGQDVGAVLRTPEISAQVSLVATNLEVRDELRDRQRALIASAREQSGGVVAEGRDLTTVVVPDAEHRVLLSASEEARLSRRSDELRAAALTQSTDSVRDQVLRRDRDDATVSAFFEPAPGVHGIDTSHLTFEQSVAAVLSVVTEPIDASSTDEGAR